MGKQLLKDSIAWGLFLWAFGYIMGIILFSLVSPVVMSFIITIVWTIVAVWILLRKIKATGIGYYAKIGIAWLIIAVVFDYFLLVKLFDPPDGYYKSEIYLYYALCFLLPLYVGWRKKVHASN